MVGAPENASRGLFNFGGYVIEYYTHPLEKRVEN